MPKPVAKTHPVRLAILGALIETRPETRKHKVWDEEAGGVVETKVSIPTAPHYPLARNVSTENVERLAKRWGR